MITIALLKFRRGTQFFARFVYSCWFSIRRSACASFWCQIMLVDSTDLHRLWFLMHKILYTQNRFRCTFVRIKEQTYTLLIITLYWITRHLKTAFHFQSFVLLLSCRWYYFSLRYDDPPFLYTAQRIFTGALPFLINWNEKWFSKS